MISPAKSTKKKVVHYVNNPDFLRALVEHKKKVLFNKENNIEPPRISNYIGECLYNISTKLSTKFCFANYTFREEMIGDGIENCILYLDNFDPDRYDNPFAYFTQIIYFAFLRRIQKEKKQTYIKHKVLEREILHMGISEYQGDDDILSPTLKLENDFMNNFVDDFENKLTEKKKTSKIARTKKLKETNNENE